MPINNAPRSVSDATRFTATTPHASSKTSAAAQGGSRFASPAGPVSASSVEAARSGTVLETPAQRVERLRAAHLRAKAAQGSRFDRVIHVGRRFFDSAHKATVVGLVGLTAITGLVTVYTAVDMLAFNKRRRREFLEAQRAMEADSLEAARLAYMTNKASEEQIQMVEEANAREVAASKIFQMPAVIGAPRPANAGSQSVAAEATWPGSAEVDRLAQEPKEEKKGGIGSWFFASGKKEKTSSGDKARSLGESISEKQGYLQAKAKQAFEQEKENQRNGGPLDRTGLAEQSSGEPKTKGWW